jgi:hypothetical protein
MVLVTKSKKPASINHRKRTGQHHRHSKPYHKAYWPYLPLLSIIGLGFVFNLLWIQPGGSVLSYATSMSAAALLQETNVERQADGKGSLVSNQQLTSAAQAKANDMAARNYWSHVTPDGNQPWWFVTNAGYNYQSTGENLAYGFDTSQAAITGWMNSPGHRANILNGDYRDIGFGIANSDNYQGQGQETIVVALYGKLAGQAAAPAAAQSSPATTTPAPTSPGTTSPATSPTAAPVVAIAPAAPAVKAATNSIAGTSTRAVANQPVARLQLISASVSPWSMLVLMLVLALAAGIFIARHAYFWHRTLVRGEKFVIKHWKIDLAIVSLVVVGVLLTRTAGFIQ